MSVVWLNGRLCDAHQAHVSVADRGLTLGDGLFETFRVHSGMLRHLDVHMARLQAGAAILDLPVPSLEDVQQAGQALCQANGIQQGSARLTVTRGVGPRGLLPPENPVPTVFMTVTSGVPTCSSVSVLTSKRVRQDEKSILCQMKSLNYLPFILARQEAARAGCGDALILNLAGRVADTTVSTVVIQESGRWLTPAITEGALPGVARAVLLGAGLVAEAEIIPQRVYEAEAVYLINSLGARSVTSLDGRPLPQCQAGFNKLCAAMDIPLPP